MSEDTFMKTRRIIPNAVNGIEAQAFDLSVGDIVELRNGLHMYIDALDGKVGNYCIQGHQEKEVVEQFADWTSTGSYYENGISLYDIVSVVEEQKPQYHKYGLIELVELLVQGTVFYTREGIEVKLSDRQFSFGKDKLDLNKLVNTPLSLVRPVPFEIDPVKGRHCFVWDDDKRQGKYAVVIYISNDSEYPYVTTGSTNFKNAEPAYT